MIKSGLVSQHRARFENGYPHQRDLHPRNETIRPGFQPMDMPILEKSVYAQPMKIMKIENGKLDIKRNPDAQVYYDQLFSNTLGPSDRFYLASLIDRIGRSGSTVTLVNNTRLGGTDRPLDNMPSDEGGPPNDLPPATEFEQFQQQLFNEFPNQINNIVLNPSQSIQDQEIDAVETVQGAVNDLGEESHEESYEESDKSYEPTPTPPERTRYVNTPVSKKVKKAVTVNQAKNRKPKSSPGLKNYKAPKYKKPITPSNITTRSNEPSNSNLFYNIEKSPEQN